MNHCSSKRKRIPDGFIGHSRPIVAEHKLNNQILSYNPSHQHHNHLANSKSIFNLLSWPASSCKTISLVGLVLLLGALIIQINYRPSEATVLMRVCDTREIKTVTNRVCMLYKRTKNSDVKLDRQGNLRITRDTKSDYSPAKLASDCCKIGCPPHIFAYNCD